MSLDPIIEDLKILGRPQETLDIHSRLNLEVYVPVPIQDMIRGDSPCGSRRSIDLLSADTYQPIRHYNDLLVSCSRYMIK